MAYDIKSRRLVDCTGGRADMQRKTVRMVSPSAFKKDPARLVRAYRMAAAFHFSIDPGTQDAIGRYRQLVGGVAGERVWVELVKIFDQPDSSPVIGQMAASGLLTAIFPELQAAVGCTQNRHHQYDVFDHSLRVYQHLETLLDGLDTRFPRLAAAAEAADLSNYTAMLKYAALLHDVGKPATRSIDSRMGGSAFSVTPQKVPPSQPASAADLRLSNRQRHVADAIIRHHIRPLFLYPWHQKMAASAVMAGSVFLTDAAT
jgi:tRNA nucleotidyltransferase/poly(A) polymerase